MPDDRNQPLSAQKVTVTVGEEIVPGLIFVERPTIVSGDLRMLRILQQQWRITTFHDGRPTSIRHEWRDVPLVTGQ